MVYFLDTGVNLLLNLAGFTGLGDPHQILIAVVLGTAAVLWNSTLVPKWALGAFFSHHGAREPGCDLRAGARPPADLHLCL